MIEVRSGAALAKSRERGPTVLEGRAAEEQEAAAAALAVQKSRSRVSTVKRKPEIKPRDSE